MERLVIYASTQNPHYDLKEVSEILGLPEEHIRIIQAATAAAVRLKAGTSPYRGSSV